MDYNGHDIKRVTTSSPEQCQKQCQGVSRCKFWTFNANDKNCYLKTSNSGKTPSESFVTSGPKYCGGMHDQKYEIYITNKTCLCICPSVPLFVSPKPFDLGWWNFICVIYTWCGRILRKKISEKSKKKIFEIFPGIFSDFFSPLLGPNSSKN